MAGLVECESCEAQIGEMARTCPKCGSPTEYSRELGQALAKLDRAKSIVTWLAFVAVALLLYFYL